MKSSLGFKRLVKDISFSCELPIYFPCIVKLNGLFFVVKREFSYRREPLL